MASFQKVEPLILALEGGDNKKNVGNDYGGETKYGISKRSFPNEDIANLTPSRALDLMFTNYWTFYHLSDISSQDIANQCFFLLVNMNPVHATLIIQAAINGVGRSIVTVKADGILGEATIQALNSLQPLWLGDRIRLEACRYYLSEVDRDESQKPNFVGWIRRALE